MLLRILVSIVTWILRIRLFHDAQGGFIHHHVYEYFFYILIVRFYVIVPVGTTSLHPDHHPFLLIASHKGNKKSSPLPLLERLSSKLLYCCG